MSDELLVWFPKIGHVLFARAAGLRRSNATFAPGLEMGRSGRRQPFLVTGRAEHVNGTLPLMDLVRFRVFAWLLRERRAFP